MANTVYTVDKCTGQIAVLERHWVQRGHCTLSSMVFGAVMEQLWSPSGITIGGQVAPLVLVHQKAGPSGITIGGCWLVHQKAGAAFLHVSPNTPLLSLQCSQWCDVKQYN